MLVCLYPTNVKTSEPIWSHERFMDEFKKFQPTRKSAKFCCDCFVIYAEKMHTETIGSLKKSGLQYTNICFGEKPEYEPYRSKLFVVSHMTMTLRKEKKLEPTKVALKSSKFSFVFSKYFFANNLSFEVQQRTLDTKYDSFVELEFNLKK